MRNQQQFWKFIKDNLTVLLTITSAVIVIILRQLGILPDSEILVAILAILTLLATTELIDKSRRLDRIENQIDTTFSNVVSALKGVEIYSFNDAVSAFDFISKNINDAENGIDHAALAPSVPTWSGQYRRYEDAITKALRSNRIRYRYLALLTAKHRIERVAKYINDPNIKQFYVKQFKEDNFVLSHNFMIFDQKIAIVNFPYEPGEPERFLAIRHPELISFYSYLFTQYWRAASGIDMQEISSVIKAVDSKR